MDSESDIIFAIIDPELGTPDAVEALESELQTLRAWGDIPPSTSMTRSFWMSSGSRGQRYPATSRIPKWFIDGTLDRQTLINVLEYFEDNGLLG